MTLIKVNNWTAQDRKREYERLMSELFPYAVRAVENSFIKAKMMNPSQTEAKQRVKLAVDLIKRMRFDYGWSRRRIKDQLSYYLSMEILGLDANLERASLKSRW